MSLDDAKRVKEHLEAAKTAAVPLKDPGLTRKIDEGVKYVTEKMDPEKG